MDEGHDLCFVVIVWEGFGGRGKFWMEAG